MGALRRCGRLKYSPKPSQMLVVFKTMQVEYEETYSLVILPEFATIPLPNAQLPQNVRAWCV